MDNNKKSVSLTVYIITLIFMFGIIAILGYIVVKNNNSNNVDNITAGVNTEIESDITASTNTENMTNSVNTENVNNTMNSTSKKNINNTTASFSTENLNNKNVSANTDNVNNKSSNIDEVDNVEDLQSALEKYLYLYCLRGGTSILTRDEGRFEYALDFYRTSDEATKDLKESDEKVIYEDGIEEELYKTSIKYSDYKEELLNYMSENLFEENFTRGYENIDGILYVANDGGCGNGYDIIKMTKNSDNSYDVECKYYEGENPYVISNLNVTFGKNNNGAIIVESCVIE